MSSQEEMDAIDAQNARSYKLIYIGVMVWYVAMTVWYAFAVVNATNNHDAVTNGYDYCFDPDTDQFYLDWKESLTYYWSQQS